MKKALVLLILIPCRAISQDSVSFSKTQIDFGKIKTADSFTDSVWLYNKGKKPVIISDYKWGGDFCPPNMKMNFAIMPGDSTVITLHCHNYGGTKTFTRVLTIQTNAGTYWIPFKGEFVKEESVVVGQKDTLNNPIYKCKAFKYDTVSKKIILKKECMYFMYSIEDKSCFKKGWGKTVDVINIKSGLYCYLYLRKEQDNTNPPFEEVKKNGYLILIK